MIIRSNGGKRGRLPSMYRNMNFEVCRSLRLSLMTDDAPCRKFPHFLPPSPPPEGKSPDLHDPAALLHHCRLDGSMGCFPRPSICPESFVVAEECRAASIGAACPVNPVLTPERLRPHCCTFVRPCICTGSGVIQRERRYCYCCSCSTHRREPSMRQAFPCCRVFQRDHYPAPHPAATLTLTRG